MLNWIKRIIIGWYNTIFHKNLEQTQERLKICMECDNKIKIGKRDYICSKCGCVLRAKCASPEEKCLIGKW